MKVLIFRHGIAEPRRVGLPEADRQLTRQGYNRTRLAAIGLTRLMRPVDAILASPYIRAQQTAAILGLAMRRRVETLDTLAADQPPRGVIPSIFQREDTSIALVGHNPQLEDLVTLLCMNTTEHRLIPIRKAGAVLLRAKHYPERSATLRWAMSPRTLRMLARRLPRQRPSVPMSKTRIKPQPEAEAQAELPGESQPHAPH